MPGSVVRHQRTHRKHTTASPLDPPESALRALNISTTTRTLMDTVDGDFDRKTSHASPSHFWNERSACQVSCGPSCGAGNGRSRVGRLWMLILRIRKGTYHSQSHQPHLKGEEPPDEARNSGGTDVGAHEDVAGEESGRRHRAREMMLMGECWCAPEPVLQSRQLVANQIDHEQSKRSFPPPLINSHRVNSHRSTMPSSARRGRCFMMSGSGLLKPMAVAGSPSVTRLTHRSYFACIREGGMSHAIR